MTWKSCGRRCNYISCNLPEICIEPDPAAGYLGIAEVLVIRGIAAWEVVPLMVEGLDRGAASALCACGKLAVKTEHLPDRLGGLHNRTNV